MTRTIAVAPVRKSIIVNTDPARAFEIFTAGIDRWWPKAKCDGASPFERFVIEPGTGGRWYAKCEDGSEVEIGRVLAWEPGRRAVFSWMFSARLKLNPATPSEVEVKFIADGPGTTRVELEHRGFDRLGKDGERMRQDVDGGWPGALTAYVKAVAE